MQVLITVLESHGKLRLLPDGTRGSALKDEMHGVIHYSLCASSACAINESELTPHQLSGGKLERSTPAGLTPPA
ncbi:hypothetical protein HaLaN_15860 [Haematococcus lacustris]|uniref:Uncharacterized protein n=1 Tax=Haematococcus lacustris TaxID=44745 RepID=A0A699ZIR4_HAELA|nr:hypothetical protein HaLaN_15860 [Haematococcus lacustris]